MDLFLIKNMLIVAACIFGIEPTNIDPVDYRVVGCLR
jgi:hypothetical protein